jgi:hypothetical protein
MSKSGEDKKLYMIRRHDGLYSTGGSWPGFTNNGKMWSSMKALNTHLSQVYSGDYWNQQSVLKRGEDGRYSKFDFGAFADMKRNPYMNCDIVEVDLVYNVKTDVFNHLALRYYKEQTPETETQEKSPDVVT